jgi:hypothetical protein
VTAVQLALFGDPRPAPGRCPVCLQAVPGTPSAKWPHLVTIAAHPHPNPALGLCVGSGCGAGYWAAETKAGAA